MEKKTKENDAFGFELLPDDPKPAKKASKKAVTKKPHYRLKRNNRRNTDTWLFRMMARK